MPPVPISRLRGENPSEVLLTDFTASGGGLGGALPLSPAQSAPCHPPASVEGQC
jgi:hypothetical protein